MIEQFLQLPKTMKALVGGLSLTTIASVLASINRRAALITAAGLLIIILAIIAWFIYKRLEVRKRAKALSLTLAMNASVSPQAIAEPDRRARFDEMRKQFNLGLKKYRDAGKDLYSLPWYIVCGEPGSGKTEAVRHCAVGFPPGMQDEMQGTGGTLNMHWWFTNQGVLLDTAGKILFQEAPAGTTTEWSEFLSLLRRARPSCPVNGLLLVIPAESLVRDSAEVIAQKAGRIAQQLERLQRSLEVRFPVFVLITKSDLINGFREFSSGLKEAALEQQMMGWSNPEPLDVPFRPAALDEHFSSLVSRLRRRRLGLLKDPTSEVPGRRLDEVDALFALPESIAALVPNLRKYLETIFVAGEWSSRPLFLRGIYFTSALTEGSALDADLAHALGLPVESLPEGRAWERERSYFLRDLFVQKIFREKGLVTRSADTRKLVRRRQLTLGGVASFGLALVLIATFWERNAVRLSLGEELSLWLAGANPDSWIDSSWHRMINKRGEFTGNDRIQLENSKRYTAIAFHDELMKRVSSNLDIPWIFRPIEAIAVHANSKRRLAQEVLFEASVVNPLVETARQRYVVRHEPWEPADNARLAALIQLEGSIQLKGLPGYDPSYRAEDFIAPLLGPSLGAGEADATVDVLNKVFDWTYFRGGAGRGQWPARWLSGGNSLLGNKAVEEGLKGFESSAQEQLAGLQDRIEAFTAAKSGASRFLEAETLFFREIGSKRGPEDWQRFVDDAWGNVQTARQALDTLLRDLRKQSGGKGKLLLSSEAKALLGEVQGNIDPAFQSIRRAIVVQSRASEAAKLASSGDPSRFTLFQDVERRLALFESKIMAEYRKKMPDDDQVELNKLDLSVLRPVASGGEAYRARAQVYEELMGLFNSSSLTGDELLGKLGSSLARANARLINAKDQIDKYDGELKAEFGTNMRRLLEGEWDLAMKKMVATYQAQFDQAFPSTLGFPLGSGNKPLTSHSFQLAYVGLEKVRGDAADATLPSEFKQKLIPSFSRADSLWSFVAALASDKGELLPFRILAIKQSEQNRALEKVLGAARSSRLLDRVYPLMRVGGVLSRIRALTDNVELIRANPANLSGQMEFFDTTDPKTIPDAVLPLRPWEVFGWLQEGSVHSDDDKTWTTVLRLPDPNTGELALPISVIFEKPLPPTERWPRFSK